MFMGEYNHTVDAKGRLIVPSKFRELLGEEFVITKGLDGCLFMYSSEEWKNIEVKFREISQFSKDARKFARFFFASAAVVNRIEIWSKDRWQETSEYDDVEEVAEHMASLGIII